MGFLTQAQFELAAQTLWADVPEGRPTSVESVKIYENRDGDTGTAEVATTNSVSVAVEPTTTVDADSGAGESDPRKLNVTATAGFAIGVPFLITAATGESEWAEPIEIKTDDYVICRYPLHNTYVNADVAETTRIQITLNTSWVSDESNLSDPTQASPRYRARWVYVYASTTYVLDTYFDLLRYPRDLSLVSPLDVAGYMRGWLDRLPSEDRETQGRDIIAQAVEEVGDDMYNEGKPAYASRDRGAMKALIVRKAIVVARRADHGQNPDLIEALADARTQYQSMCDKRIRITPQVPMAGDTAGAAVTTRPRSITVR